jgi:hypothetical protein
MTMTTCACGNKHYAKGLCHKCYDRAYQKTPEYKAYRKSDRYKAYRKAYQQSAKYKAYLRVYHKSDGYKAYQTAYQKTPEYKAYKRVYQKAYQNQISLSDRVVQRQLRRIKNPFERVDFINRIFEKEAKT